MTIYIPISTFLQTDTHKQSHIKKYPYVIYAFNAIYTVHLYYML